ncbi:hypothetical protein [uncultured Dechloromonas sp.]|uniref:hypothetical protein n=1 Tax=uncultured Dechloromonas sp. TaxID=171719 RepID=UPI0025D76F2D|nr:hypothetical protein [uncultured Dechloromonas sp.]
MKNRPNRFRGLLYNGDWYKKLVTALKLAKEGTCSQELLATIEVLERQLSQADECLHTVTAIQVVPSSMRAQFLLNHIRQCVDVEPATLLLAQNGDIELTITARGSREHVHSMAEAILSSGLALAKAKIWIETTI